jgi:hypothetical protein
LYINGEKINADQAKMSSSTHTTLIAKALLEDLDNLDEDLLKFWLTLGCGSEINITGVVGLLAAHPHYEAAKLAAKKLQAALWGTALANQFDIIKMLSLDTDGAVIVRFTEEEPVLVAATGDDEWDFCA